MKRPLKNMSEEELMELIKKVFRRVGNSMKQTIIMEEIMYRTISGKWKKNTSKK